MAVIVITGASSGIGEAAARLLAREGHSLVLAARRVERLERLEQELSKSTQVLCVRTDVIDPASIEQLAQKAVDRFGQIDVWINNAGVGQVTRWWERPVEEIRYTIDINLMGAILGARAALRHMLPRGKGHIINIASVAGHVASASLYSASKFGLRGHSEALRREMLSRGIDVSIVSPGFIETEMTASRGFKMPPADLIARVVSNVIRRPRREVVSPGWYRPLIWLARIWPGAADYVLVKYLMKG